MPPPPDDHHHGRVQELGEGEFQVMVTLKSNRTTTLRATSETMVEDFVRHLRDKEGIPNDEEIMLIYLVKPLVEGHKLGDYNMHATDNNTPYHLWTSFKGIAG